MTLVDTLGRKVPSLQGVIGFDTRFATTGSRIIQNQIIAAVESAHSLNQGQKGWLLVLSECLALTRDVTFDLSPEQERLYPELCDFRMFWEWYATVATVGGYPLAADERYRHPIKDDAIVAAVWLKYAELVGDFILERWIEATRETGTIYAASLLDRRDEALSEEQRRDEDLKKKEKPVA